VQGSLLLSVGVFDDLQAFEHVIQTKSFHRPEWRKESGEGQRPIIAAFSLSFFFSFSVGGIDLSV